MGKPTICIGKNKGADQLCSNCTADQHLCFRYTDSTILLLLISKIYSKIGGARISGIGVEPHQMGFIFFILAEFL